MKGAVIRAYKAGSIIYFEGDRGSNVFVLQKGAIRLIYTTLDGQEEVQEDVKKGEFFGVKSSLGRYPREETAQVLADSTVLLFDLKNFENLCLKNVRLVLQMLKVFSSQLRRVHKQVREQLGELNSLENSAELLRVGEYYYKQGNPDMAKYIFEKFMHHYPKSDVYDRAVILKQNLESGNPYPENLSSLSQVESTAGFGSPEKIAPLNENALNDPMNFSLMDEPMLGTGGTGGVGETVKKEGVSNLFYEGLNLISHDLDSAIQKFEKVMRTKNFSDSKEALMLEKAHFELSKCYLKKGDSAKAVDLTSDFVRKYPNSAQIKKALITLAEAFENQGNITKAKAFYAKVANLAPQDQDSSLANKRLKKLKG